MVGLWLTPIPAVLLLLLSYLLVNLVSIAWIPLWWRRGISEKARDRGIWETRAGEGISYSGIQRTLRIVQSTGHSERNGSTHYEGQDCWVVGMHQTCSQRLESGNQKEQEQGRCNVKRWELVQRCCPKGPELSEPVFASKERSWKVMSTCITHGPHYPFSHSSCLTSVGLGKTCSPAISHWGMVIRLVLGEDYSILNIRANERVGKTANPVFSKISKKTAFLE